MRGKLLFSKILYQMSIRMIRYHLNDMMSTKPQKKNWWIIGIMFRKFIFNERGKYKTILNAMLLDLW